jgi:hypothetical protein
MIFNLTTALLRPRPTLPKGFEKRFANNCRSFLHESPKHQFVLPFAPVLPFAYLPTTCLHFQFVSHFHTFTPSTLARPSARLFALLCPVSSSQLNTALIGPVKPFHTFTPSHFHTLAQFTHHFTFTRPFYIILATPKAT